MTAAALARSLPDSIQVTIVETGVNPVDDIFYGQILPPQAYAFHLSIGLSEPELLLNTGTTFALGTQFQSWAQTDRSWVQAFHQPLPVWDGVPLTKLIHQRPHASLQSILITAQAGLKGVFAHPSEDGAHLLSRAEYGYAVDPNQLSALYKASTLRRPIPLITAQIVSVQRASTGITGLTLSDGQTLHADLFIDCTGPLAQLQEKTTATAATDRTVKATLKQTSGTPLGAALQYVRSGGYGWRSEVILRSGARRLTVCDANAQTETSAGPDVSTTLTLGSRPEGWRTNCIAIGQAAYVIEPFTTAPMKLLLRDIDRVLKLFPISTDMRIDAQEYNRLFRDDYAHASLFNQAHFAMSDYPETPYWQGTAAHNQDPKLVRKLTQYESRGYLAAYDNEPFDDVDWAVLHDGMGRTPQRRDPLAALVDPATIDTRLDALQNAIQSVVKKMPPHPIYMGKFLSYLQRKYTRNG
ncbi:tryptophan halogenase [Algimonas arctica]|uniref:Tryptophan halogenase n=2 Tax=Algimonas arctica TaxID=1479486 RepID=A0A8J3CQQ5_9PROT|nr:tryptophan halogenase [Algimonas arctica]